MPEFRVSTASRLYRAAFKHVEETGHSKLSCADKPREEPPRIGILCIDCGVGVTWWTSPIPGPGHFTDWPHEEGGPTFHFPLAEARRQYLEFGIQRALEGRSSGPAPEAEGRWERLRSKKGVGW